MDNTRAHAHTHATQRHKEIKTGGGQQSEDLHATEGRQILCGPLRLKYEINIVQKITYRLVGMAMIATTTETRDNARA